MTGEADGVPCRRVLVVEDDEDIARLIEMHLTDCGFSVTVVRDGIRAEAVANDETFSLITLDLGLPGIDGIELCRRLRRCSCYTPILMLSARSTELDRVLGLELGADDYLTKPFSVRELQARVKAICRRGDALAAQANGATPSTIRLGTLVIDIERRAVTIENKAVQLRAKEFALLREFALHPGKVYSRAALLEGVWKYAHEGYRHTVNTHINRLRMKIEKNPARPSLIRTVHGVGYQLVPDFSTAAP
ncbi:MAG: response regulator transcription factor [Pseudomonadota bacterium]|jgi:DNA-binding response OmpR family regulator|nr:response regulator transcription factor [Pseudomonadota bacterium]